MNSRKKPQIPITPKTSLKKRRICLPEDVLKSLMEPSHSSQSPRRVDLKLLKPLLCIILYYIYIYIYIYVYVCMYIYIYIYISLSLSLSLSLSAINRLSASYIYMCVYIYIYIKHSMASYILLNVCSQLAIIYYYSFLTDSTPD